MFTAKEFTNVREANEYIKKILAELDTPSSMEYQIIHSISETQAEEDGGEWNDVGEIALNYLHDLNSQQGFMHYDNNDGECWDFLDWDEPDEVNTNIYKPEDPDEIYVYAGEGMVVLHNQFAVCENQYPIIVVKKSFWEKQEPRILDILKYCEPGCDYTSKISPAVYVELFYVEDAVAT